jgi:membrane protein required for colicin V production
MTIFDYAVLFILICSVVISMMRGLVSEILSLLGWIVALVVANAYGEALATMLPGVIPGHVARLIVAFVILFIGVKLLVSLLTMAIEAVITASGLVIVDRGLGVLFGAVRGVVIVLAAVLVCGMTALPQQEFWKQAMLRPYAESAARAVMPYLPDNVAKYIKF